MREGLYRCFGLVAAAALLAALPATGQATTIRVGSDVSGAPFEYYAANHKMDGFDLDVLAAMSAKLGRPIMVFNHQFDDLIAAVRRGDFDFAMSAMSDTRAREQRVDFVDYFLAGGGIMVPAANPHRIFAIDALCGYSVAVEAGTEYETLLDAQSRECQKIHLGPIKIVTSATDDGAFAIFTSGKTDAYVTDYPVGVYRAKTAGGGTAYVMAGKQFNVVPYGIAVKKQNAALRAELVSALAAVIADGTYDRLLRKWNLQLGALRSAPVNAGTLFQK